MSNYFNKMYLKENIYYQVTNLDSRIDNPDQRMTADIENWADSLSIIYGNLTKPLFDMYVFSKKLAELLSWKGPACVIGWYFFALWLIKNISP